MESVLKSATEVIGEYGIKWESKTLLDLDYAGDLSLLYENVCKMNGFFGDFESSG